MAIFGGWLDGITTFTKRVGRVMWSAFILANMVAEPITVPFKETAYPILPGGDFDQAVPVTMRTTGPSAWGVNVSVSGSGPLACLSHSRAIWARARGVTRAVATRRSGKRQSEDLPPSIMLGFLASCCCLVLAQHKPKEGWQRPPLLQHRGESASPCGQDGTANRVVSGRDQ